MPDGRQLCLVQFYSYSGEHLRTMRVPGSSISSIAWEGSGLRLALAIDGSMYFTSVRQAYLWGQFADTLVYAFSKPGRAEHCVMFWGRRGNERHVKYVKRISHICAAAELCMLVTKVSVSVTTADAGWPEPQAAVRPSPWWQSHADACYVSGARRATAS